MKFTVKKRYTFNTREAGRKTACGKAGEMCAANEVLV